MYSNNILRIWIIDLVDYFLISILLGSLVVSFLRRPLSGKESMKRLKDSIISKSKLVGLKTLVLISNSKKFRIKTITHFALKKRVGTLASFIKQRELQGLLKIF